MQVREARSSGNLIVEDHRRRQAAIVEPITGRVIWFDYKNFTKTQVMLAVKDYINGKLNWSKFPWVD